MTYCKLYVWVMALCCGVVVAEPLDVSASSSKTPPHSVSDAGRSGERKLLPNQLVEQAINALIERFKVLGRADPPVDDEAYIQAVAHILGPVVDFELIAKRVMARYYRYATEAQIERFTLAFKQSLLSTYAKGMVAYSDRKMELLPFKGVETGSKSGKVRAKVEMNVYSKEGKAYPIVYAMYQNSSGDWKLENVTLNGINIGLTFRNQFNEAMKKNQGDIDRVISSWNVSLAQAAG